MLLTNLLEVAHLISSQLFDNVEQFSTGKNHMVRDVQGAEQKQNPSNRHGGNETPW